MEKLSIKVADLLLKNQYIEESMYNIYQYGMQMALEMGLSFVTSVAICCIWGRVAEGIIFFAVFIPLRSYLGGYHLKSYAACYICSCVTFVMILGMSFLQPYASISWLILSVSIVIIFLEAKREKMRDEEGRHFYPKICAIILAILVAGVVLTALDAVSKLFLLACTVALVAASKLLERAQAIKKEI